jgi:hypothetical protein
MFSRAMYYEKIALALDCMQILLYLENRLAKQLINGNAGKFKITLCLGQGIS